MILDFLLNALGLYATLGGIFALLFVLFGVKRTDPAADGGAWGFRVLIFPGVVAFWPLFLIRLLRKAQAPEERNAHRRAAHASRAIESRGGDQ